MTAKRKSHKPTPKRRTLDALCKRKSAALAAYENAGLSRRPGGMSGQSFWNTAYAARTRSIRTCLAAATRHAPSEADEDDEASSLLRGYSTAMGSLKKRSVNLAGHATSLALEPEFWGVLEVAAAADAISLAALIQKIDTGRGERPLASACRVFALQRAGVDQPGRGEMGGGIG